MYIMYMLEIVLDALFPPRERDARVRALALHDIPSAPEIHGSCGEDILSIMPYRSRNVRDLIWTLKYRGTSDAVCLCSGALADALAEPLAEEALFRREKQLLVPIPLSRERLRERGYNQMELVARETVRMLPVEYGVQFQKALVRNRHTPPQTSLSRRARLKNVQDAFAVPEPEDVRGTHVLLIDDVATTGATLAEAACTLRNAGASVTAIALARA